MDDRRKYPRFKMGVEVHWKKVAGAAERTAQHISQTKDVSAGGICLVLHPGIEVGDTLELEVQWPGKQGIRVRGQVAWLERNARVAGRTGPVCEGGLRFLDTTEETETVLSQFITHSFRNDSRK